MTKVFLLLGYVLVLVVVNAGTYGGQKVSLEDIERDFSSKQGSTNYVQPKAGSSSVISPSRFGFVPKRTASSYAATKPKTQYLQTQYRVKQTPHETQPSQYATAYTQPQPQYTTVYTQPQSAYQQQSSTGSSQVLDNSQLYSSGSQQYIPQQNAQDYVYLSPQVQQQSVVQYQQPSQQYDQYENVQYVTDNSIAKTEAQPQQYYSQAPQPQYYYVQQYQSPSTAVESIIDPKSLQYATYVPVYSPNSIPIDQKQTEAYSTSSEPQLPPVTTTVAKYTTVVPSKSSSSKQYVSQKDAQYIVSSAKKQYSKQEDILFNREPKSLLDSYVPSILQLQYLKRQGKSLGYTKF